MARVSAATGVGDFVATLASTLAGSWAAYNPEHVTPVEDFSFPHPFPPPVWRVASAWSGVWTCFQVPARSRTDRTVWGAVAALRAPHLWFPASWVRPPR